MIRRILMLVGCCLAVAALSAAQVYTGRLAASLPTSAASQPARNCTGKVVDADDKPLADATVQLYQWDNGTDEPRILAELTTKQDGAFSFPLPGGGDPNANGGAVARKAGLAIGFDNWRADRSDTTGLTLKLGKPSTMSGVVVDEAGGPLAGAEVATVLQVPDPARYRYTRGSRWAWAKTNAKGEFQIENLPANARAELEVSAAGRATIMTMSRSGKFTYAAGETGIRIALPEEAKVAGTVIDEATSRPVAGVKLRAVGVGMRGASATTGADGRFSLAKLPAGRLTVALAPGEPTTGAMDWLAEPASVTTEAGKTAGDVTVTVSKGGVVEVAVTDGKTNAPVPRAYVSLAPVVARGVARGSQTGQNGVARVRVRPGRYQLAEARAAGFVPVDIRSGPPETVNVAEGQAARLSITLQPLPTIRGVVKDTDGKPVAGASISSRFGVATITGPDGAFELKTNPAMPGGGGPNELFARHAERGLAGVAEVSQDDKPIELTLASAPTLLGKVTDAEGKPIPNAELRLTRMSGKFGYGFGQTPMLKSDAEGRYEIKAIPSGSYWVSATADGFGEKQEKFSVADGQVEAIEKSFALPEARLSLSGIVVDMDDKPVAGANVSVYGQGQPNRQAQTDAAGKFVIDKVVSASVQLQANAESRGKRLYGLDIKAKGGDKDVRIVLNQEADGTGRIRKIAREGSGSLVGKPLPKLEPLGLKPAAELAGGKRLLVCFFDMEQHPSRRMVQALSEKAGELEKNGVKVVLVHAAACQEEQLRDWAATNKLLLPLGSVGQDKDKVATALAGCGVTGLPWLILTDDKHVVAAEGLALDHLEEALDAPATKPAAAK